MRSGLDWLLQDRTTTDHRWVVAQWPNTAAWVFVLLTALGWVVGGATWLYAGTRVALVWWAVDEVVRGVNPFRRVLGAGCCDAGGRGDRDRPAGLTLPMPRAADLDDLVVTGPRPRRDRAMTSW